MVEVEGLGKRYQGNWVFRRISLQVRPQESIVILGPSGGGKSVLLKMIAGLVRPTEGAIQLQTQNIGMLFQKNALFDYLTVEENLLFPLKERTSLSAEEAKQKATAFLSAVGLEGTQELYPDEISGGMQKRLGIARALIVEPELILYDEPTAGLDPITSKRIADLIKKLHQARKGTLITVTNDMQRAYQLGDRLFLLAQGRLIEGGTPQQVRQTQQPELKQFIYGLQEGPLTSEHP